MLEIGIKAMEQGLLPTSMIRYGIRLNAKSRLEQFGVMPEDQQSQQESFIRQLKESPIAISTEQANEQHYEVPPEFFVKVLGPNLKYSSCYYETSQDSLQQAEETMLKITCERAEIQNGQNILELGCGWGSLTLWMASHYPDSKIHAVSNSSLQKNFILNSAKARGLANVTVTTADLNDFEANDQYDRIVSIEMFEHMRNYQKLLNKIGRWLKANGKLFVHIFCHHSLAYPYETVGSDNWMGKYFFTGGIMPSRDLLLRFNDDLKVDSQWLVNGKHYQLTSEAWLKNLDRNKNEVLSIFEKCYGAESRKWFYRWRTFFLACAEVFGFNDGKEWMVTHMLFSKHGQ